MKLRRDIGEMERIPRGYGYAYRRWDCMIVVCYPVPLNVIVSFVRRVWIRLVHFGSQTDPAAVAWVAGNNYGREFAAREAAREYTRGFDEGVKSEQRYLRDFMGTLRGGAA